MASNRRQLEVDDYHTALGAVLFLFRAAVFFVFVTVSTRGRDLEGRPGALVLLALPFAALELFDDERVEHDFLCCNSKTPPPTRQFNGLPRFFAALPATVVRTGRF